MILVSNYIVGLLCCIYCCICWGSWSNTQKMVKEPRWTSELYYWDLTIGLIVTAIVGALTLGCLGGGERTFLKDFANPGFWSSIKWAILGGVVWNVANIFFAKAISIAGMAIAFPIGGGLGWIGGVIYNYILVVAGGNPYPGSTTLLWVGVAIVVVAIILCTLAYKKVQTAKSEGTGKAIILALVSAIGFAFFYGLVVKSIDPQIVTGGAGTLTPYTGVFGFALGILITTPIVNPIMMKNAKLADGSTVTMKDYFAGRPRTHLIGMLGGLIWMSGELISFMGSAAANPAISYALSNASPIVAMIWGVFVWKEFKDAPKGTMPIVVAMFTLFVVGLVLVTMSN